MSPVCSEWARNRPSAVEVAGVWTKSTSPRRIATSKCWAVGRAPAADSAGAGARAGNDDRRSGRAEGPAMPARGRNGSATLTAAR